MVTSCVAIDSGDERMLVRSQWRICEKSVSIEFGPSHKLTDLSIGQLKTGTTLQIAQVIDEPTITL